MCFIFPMFLPWSAEESNIAARLMPPEWFSRGLEGHILGTDQLGRDVLTRLLIGGQFSFSLALVVVTINMTVGTVMGLISGYFGGWVDRIIMRLCDALMSMPTMILAIAIIAILGRSTTNLIIVMTITGWDGLCRITRNNVRVVKNREFALASTALGAKSSHIMFSQIFPNVSTTVIIIASQRIAGTIMLESSLSFLGLGVMPPAASWGVMISHGRQFLTTHPWLIIVPGFALMIAVLSSNFLGDGVRDILDTKRKI
jgi:ABC-type dipeptide/oligopeptide/nickel transport system permease subunit